MQEPYIETTGQAFSDFFLRWWTLTCRCSTQFNHKCRVTCCGHSRREQLTLRVTGANLPTTPLFCSLMQWIFAISFSKMFYKRNHKLANPSETGFFSPFKSIHIAAGNKSLCFFVPKWNFLGWMYHNPLNHAPVKGQTYCLQFAAPMNKTAVAF